LKIVLLKRGGSLHAETFVLNWTRERSCTFSLGNVFIFRDLHYKNLAVERIAMSGKVSLMKRFAEIAFERFDEAMKGITKEEVNWQPMEEANSIRWILMHLSQQWNVGIPGILKGDPEFKPEGWPEDYVGRSCSFEKLMDYLNKGKNAVLRGLEELGSAELEAEIPLWGGTRKREYGLLIYLSEIYHHEGQIAYLRGAIGRRRQTDEHFLT